MFLSVDKPHRTATLHSSECPYFPQPVGTTFKPVGQRGRDGGWFLVLSVPVNQWADFRAPSLDAIYIATQGQLLLTTDRGASWRPIRDGWLRLIAAPTDKELVLIVSKGSSDSSDTATTSDAIAYSKDAGATWEETPLVGGLITSSKRAQSLSSDVHKVMLHERVLTVLTARE